MTEDLPSREEPEYESEDERIWHETKDPHEMLDAYQMSPMLDMLRGTLGDDACNRKVRLFMSACCRNVYDLLNENRQRAVQLLEKTVEDPKFLLSRDGLAEITRLDDDEDDFISALTLDDYDSSSLIIGIMDDITNQCRHEIRRGRGDERLNSEPAFQANFIRDIFGNPFAKEPVVLNPDWRTSDVVAVAQSIYEEKGFDRMPLLADALQDAGCKNEEILNHCRAQDCTHVRGCWVVDLILEKK